MVWNIGKPRDITLPSVTVPGKGRGFSLHHLVQTSSGAHPVSYPVGTSGEADRA
jgi:hypothetical protein